MPRSTKMLAIALSTLIVLIIIFSLLAFYGSEREVVFNESYGDATISIKASRDAILFPGECLVLEWEMTGISSASLSLNNKITTINAIDHKTYCLWIDTPIIDLEFSDNTSQSYTLPIRHLYRSFPVFILLVLSCASVCILSYLLFDVAGVLIIVTAISFTPILMTGATTGYDFSVHLGFIRNMQLSGNPQDLPPHFTFHYLTLAVTTIIPAISLENAAFIVVTIAQCFTAHALYSLLNILQAQSGNSRRMRVLNAVLAYLLLWVGPMSFFTRGITLQMESALLFANTYHSPTMLVMRPLSIYLFILLIRSPEKWSNRVIAYIGGIALLLLVGAHAKPSFIMVIVPAYIMLLCIQYLRDKQVNKIQLIVAATLIITMILALGWQYLAIYGDTGSNLAAKTGSGIKIEIFGLYRILRVAPLTILIEWFVSLIFPISVYLLYFKRAWRDNILNFSWIALAGAIAMIVIFIEVTRADDGNFGWATRITTLIVYTTSIGFILRQHHNRTETGHDWQFWFCISLFIVHALFYASLLINTFMGIVK